MNQKELKELIDFLIEKDISEFELERGDVKVRIKRGGETAATVITHAVPMASVPMSAPPGQTGHSATAAAPPPASTPTAPPAAAEEELHTVKSPIVGTFYEAPGPGALPFVKPGDQVAAGQVLCIIEAMKLMNEIEADASGEVVKVLVNNGQPVEYGQPLFAIRPRK
ncbi:MAG TPA: acetyl-CoA carboxylase biotin carboxyl carrier protein [Candidatus Polarisedimenticolia bacterium]|jgi:acetyl-CoA carboxylase biotin carboxyl carrier protein|nr:acetyl-CoA carboxylase biotin carboxyl carrier protein [Candidatus Polarisedimenticolia bacterium]